MGIDYDGGMIVGEIGRKLNVLPDDAYAWAEENNMICMSLYYEADKEDMYYGFPVENIFVSAIDKKWIDDLKEKAAKFEKLTGVPAMLVGTQNIW